MRKILMAGAAAATLIGGTSLSAAPATAQGMHMHGDRGGHFEGRGDFGERHEFRGFRGDRDRFDGDDLAFGLFGLGLGAAVASNGYYGYGPGYYYGPDYDYDYGYYGTCYSRRWVWDPYWGRYRLERVRYAC